MAKDTDASDQETPQEGQHGAQEADLAASGDEYQEVKAQTSGADQAAAEDAGFHGALAEPDDGDPNAIMAADQAAPAADVENTEHPEGFHAPGGLSASSKDTQAVAIGDLPGYPRHLTQTPESRVGFLGEVPTSPSEREAMTLKAQAAVAKDQYGDGDTSATTT